MNYSFNWDIVAINTYIEETEIGTFNTKFDLYTLIISKQTTLYYNFNSSSKIISLYVFWNNSKNPNDLTKLL